MLSNIELILMQFIKTKPSYAYEIEKSINKCDMKKWVKISNPTVYQVLDRLCKKGLLEYKIEKEGNMPERKRYYITDEGNMQFMDSARETLRNIEYYDFNLTVGLFCRNFFNDREFSSMIRERLVKINEFIGCFNESFEKAKDICPKKRSLVREYLYSHYVLEKEFLEKLLKEAGESIE